MTYEQRRRRRAAMATELDAGACPRSVASKYRLSLSTVYQAKQDRGIVRRRLIRPSRYDWTAVDWSLSDAEVARRLGCSPQRVNVKRHRQKMLGYGQPAEHRRL